MESVHWWRRRHQFILEARLLLLSVAEITYCSRSFLLRIFSWKGLAGSCGCWCVFVVHLEGICDNFRIIVHFGELSETWYWTDLCHLDLLMQSVPHRTWLWVSWEVFCLDGYGSIPIRLHHWPWNHKQLWFFPEWYFWFSRSFFEFWRQRQHSFRIS